MSEQNEQTRRRRRPPQVVLVEDEIPDTTEAISVQANPALHIPDYLIEHDSCDEVFIEEDTSDNVCESIAVIKNVEEEENEQMTSDEYTTVNLIRCPDCGAMVSPKAYECVRCGCPLRKREEDDQSEKFVVSYNNKSSSGMGFWGTVFAIVVGLAIFGFCG